MIDQIVQLAGGIFDRAVASVMVAFVAPGFRLYYVYAALSIVVAAAAYRYYYSNGRRFDVREFFRFAFPRDVYTHPSAKVDYALYFVNRILFPTRIFLGGFSAALVAGAVATQLYAWFGPNIIWQTWTMPKVFAFTICFALVSDFATFFTHAVHHRVPVLWEFHKVHHTAEVLTPFTLYRKHPLYDIFSAVVRGLLAGAFQGVVVYFFVQRPTPVFLFGINFVYALFHAVGSNLRHTHVWLSYGPVLSRIFVSPAQHQIHHSTAERHWNTNYGEVFAFWDWMLGSLYVPTEREELTFGVRDGVDQEHPTLLAAYTVPFVNAYRIVKGRSSSA